MSEVRAGSDRAFEVLFDRHYPRLLAFCRHLLGSVEEAEDAVQHTFLAAYRDLVGSQQADRRSTVAVHDRPPPLPVDPARTARTSDRGLARARDRQSRRRCDPTGGSPCVARRHGATARRAASGAGADGAGRPLARRDRRGAGLPARQDQVARIHGALVAHGQPSGSRRVLHRDPRATGAPHKGGLSQTTIRRHVHACEPCRSFRADVRAQRRGFALLLPVMASPGLRASVLSAVFGGGGGTGGVAVSGALLGGDLAAKALIVAAVVGGSGVATTIAPAGQTSDRIVPTTTAPQSVATTEQPPGRRRPAAGRGRAAPIDHSMSQPPATGPSRPDTAPPTTQRSPRGNHPFSACN